jgi:hypothetical protein
VPFKPFTLPFTQVEVNVIEAGKLDVVMKDDPCNPTTQPQFLSIDVDWSVPEVR